MFSHHQLPAHTRSLLTHAPIHSVRVQLACPDPDNVDLDAIRKVFPYGTMLPIVLQDGGMRARSGIALEEMGDKNDDFLIAVACVTVGY